MDDLAQMKFFLTSFLNSDKKKSTMHIYNFESNTNTSNNTNLHLPCRSCSKESNIYCNNILCLWLSAGFFHFSFPEGYILNKDIKNIAFYFLNYLKIFFLNKIFCS
jgi:hypothetical protein